MYEKILQGDRAPATSSATSRPTPARDGAWRPVEIKLKRPDLKGVKLRTRPGYFAALPRTGGAFGARASTSH